MRPLLKLAVVGAAIASTGAVAMPASAATRVPAAPKPAAGVKLAIAPAQPTAKEVTGCWESEDHYGFECFTIDDDGATWWWSSDTQESDDYK